ncbi:MAG: hypothetical protein EA370_17575 [Wenzhouxiangella sp.]|nr:MAG: hypothetical protein EA370_17575 [Wenzhouxiangella sp.]
MRALRYLAAALLLPWSGVAMAAPFDPGRLDYAVQFNGKRVDWHSFAFFVLPRQEVPIRIYLDPDTPVVIEAGSGILRQTGDLAWEWQGPDQAGLHPIVIRPEGRTAMTLNVVTKVPTSKVEDAWIEGYRIGHYPTKPLRGNPIYLPPHGFIEVTPELVDMPVSPHFTLGQFLCKQQPDHWPKYMVLREALVAKLEIILEEVNQRGIRTDGFHIMSGFRTPWYNQSIGNGRFSRHVWGGAADIFIDSNGDGRMDDLNGDGKSDIRDAEVLLGIIEDLYETRKHQRLHGGLGLYGPRPHRGSFVHVDARGQEARWSVP